MDREQIMKQLIAFAETANPFWPFAAVAVDKDGNEVGKAADCAHLSPLYHAECVLVHVLTTAGLRNGALTLFCTAEPDVMAQSAIHWANTCKELGIKEIYYGAPLEAIQGMWPYGIDIKAEDVAARCRGGRPHIHEPLLEEECVALFERAKEKQKQETALPSPMMENYFTTTLKFP